PCEARLSWKRPCQPFASVAGSSWRRELSRKLEGEFQLDAVAAAAGHGCDFRKYRAHQVEAVAALRHLADGVGGCPRPRNRAGGNGERQRCACRLVEHADAE